MVNFHEDGSIEVDATIDASLYGAWNFGAYDVFDPKVESTMRQIKEALWCNTPIGGIARYPNDYYYRVSEEVPGNPWFITTLWLARYEIACAKKVEDLSKAMELLQWVAGHAFPSGVLAEQVHPHTGEPLSVSPLTWSHGTFVSTVQDYLMKLGELEKCKACGQPKIANNRFQIHLFNANERL
jgi:GH15 family glucan-1,4-alpha-glucosidase